MTKEEAIELIHDIQTDAVYSILPEEKEALDMAISALSENKGECISIDDAMSVFDDFMCGDVDEDGTATFLEMLKDKAESEEV